ncbi:rhamnan synthesis F family protein [Deefgea piscis]|uniref:rhamnan synthesis F family protein n=1 Tax=Deefgea piscis TaxID=2739061 RepID=UPI001C8188F3|nr:rhamnan synthesis F family protein [Deefgea piscis]QZA80032.1 glycosyltransferase [Deefgea piscis]
MSFELNVSTNLIRFNDGIAEIKKLLNDKNNELALRQAQGLAAFAWHNSTGVFSSPELEELIARASACLPACSIKLQEINKQGGRHVVMLMSSLSASGGHSRIAWRWMELDCHSQYTLVLTNQIECLPIQLKKLIDQRRLKVEILNESTLLERAIKLRSLFRLADFIVLLIHPYEVLANAALAGMESPPPVLFQDHASHAFSLGVTVSNVVLSMSGALLQSRKGISPEHIKWLPLPLDFNRLNSIVEFDIRKQYGISNDDFLLMSCGSPYKYLSIDGVSLADIVSPILEKNKHVHLMVVGPDYTNPWDELRVKFPERLHCVGHLYEEALVAAYSACDIYLDSTPFTSPTALFEAAAMTKPVVRFAPVEWRKCEFSLDIESTMPTSLYVWSDKISYCKDVQRLIDDKEFRAWRGKLGYTSTRLFHADETFSYALDAAYEQASYLERITIDPYVSAARYTLIDNLLQQLGGNMSRQCELDQTLNSNKLEGQPSIAVVLHLYYLDQWKDIVVSLENIPVDFDLIVTTTPENQGRVGDLLTHAYPAAKLYITENRGRDIGPLITLLQYENLSKYDFVCKLHTKKSLHLDPEFVQKWRNEVLNSLLPSPDGVKAILDLFNARPEVGIIAGAGGLLHAHYSPGGNINLLRELAARLGFNLDEMAYEFPGASMFWCRGRVFDSLRSLNITVDDFEPELGQTNGTLAHAIERLFPLIAYHQGLLTVDAGYQGNVPNPRFPNSSEEYLDWLNQQKLSESEAKHFDIHAESTVMPKVTICIIDRFGDKNLVIKTIKSISQQLYSNLNVMICSAAENPMPGGGLDWIKTNQDFYSTCLNFNHDCDWLGFLEAGDELTLSGLLLAMHQIVDKEEWKSVYFDDDIINLDGRPACPRFKPYFDINLIRSMPYADGFLLLRHDQLELLQSIKTDFFGCEQIAVLLSIYECYGAQSIGHVSELVAHLNINDARVLSNLTRYQAFVGLIYEHFDRLGIVAEILDNQRVEGAVRIQYAISDSPLVSIIIPTKNQLPMLQRCLESILEKTSYQTYEIIVVDNQSDDPRVAPYLQQLESILAGKLRVLSYPHAFNFSAINNFAVSQARGEYLVLLNNDTAMIQSSWLDELLHHAARPDVGVVGAKLLYPSGLVQHAGVVLGLRGPADHPCIGAAHESSGYMHRLQLEQNYSAVTAACLMIRRSVYQQVGGMNEVDFKVSYNDVDLCLKVGELGLLVVWTPFSVVLHEGSVSQNTVDVAKQTEKLRRFQSEQQAMYAKWSTKIGNDPAYNKNLTLSGNGFELEHRALLSWNPLTWHPAPKILCHPADQMGCGNYRLIQPFLALEQELKITGSLTFELLPPFELAKYNPDVMIFQRQITEQQLEFMRQARSCNSSFKIYELDDYLPNLPLKSAHRDQMPKDVLKSLRKALTMVDRFVVSTDELANAYSGLHSNIHVVNNYLSPSVWGGVSSARRQSKKPRVGWAGGVSHTGDLELIADVVKELAGEVEWVFFGMCPDKLRPYVHEFHAGVPINEYPTKLASLNLDVALAPLEHNLFNRCKSNLRLLEYGVCGYPVICTDIEPYAQHLPVTRVKNRHKDWVDAIRAHTADLDHAARMGDELKFAVNKDWMLREHNLDLWLAAWSGAKS